jgi:hypothetical protein
MLVKNTVKINECLEQKPISNFTVVQSSSDCVLVNLSVRRTMGKNWLRSVMTISGTFGVQPGRGAQPQVSGNGLR